MDDANGGGGKDVRAGRDRLRVRRPFLRASEGRRASRPVRSVGLFLALVAGAPLADTPTPGDPAAGTALTEGRAASSDDAPPPAPPRGGMIPREALVDMVRAQSALLCSSEIFLGCMGFDGTTCRSLSESAIDRCLMTLPAEIDPDALDNASLEACPRTVYEKAGYREDAAGACLESALDPP